MRARAAVAALLVMALAAAQAATAQGAASVTTIHFKPSGSVKVFWHGDRKAGCAAAGLCDYAGSIGYPAPEIADLDMFRDGASTDISGFVDAFGSTTVRTLRAHGVDGTIPAECRDRSRDSLFTLDIERAYSGRYSASLGSNITPSPAASGRCAGPRLADFTGSLPSVAFRLRDVRRRGHRLSLKGRFPFTAGPLSGRVVSTLVLRTRRVERYQFREPPHRQSTPRMLFVDLDYDVARARGEIAADFSAVESPMCEMLDACGTSGRSSYSVDTRGGSLHVVGVVRTHSRRRPKLKKALQMVLRHGFLFGFGQLNGETTATLDRPGAPTCNDRVRPGPAVVTILPSHHRPRLVLGARDYYGAVDVLHARCPGPTERDVADGSALASKTFSVAALTRRGLRAVLERSGRFSSRGYRGTRTAHVELDLRRTRARVSFNPLSGHAFSVITRSEPVRLAQRP